MVLVDFGSFGSIKRGKRFRKLIGTPAFLAPEVLDESYDKRCDV